MKDLYRKHGLSRFDTLSLTKRYLLWMYKTTKDEVDRIDRRFTQLDTDRFIADFFFKLSGRLNKKSRDALSPFFQEWDDYIAAKEQDADRLKYAAPGELEARYAFLHLKLQAVLAAARHFLGPKSIGEFQRLYETKSIEQILADTSGKR